ncbi:hypothetical protein HZC30_03460 [Candidatus Woesearchaeota archaeon]|nr:hypothetical protein [Candidatus Woesearchaeota archaeon]
MGVEIHVIKRNGKQEYRCGNNTSDSYYLNSHEEPFDKLEEAVAHMVDWQVRNHYGVFDDLSHPNASNWDEPETRESAIQGWTKHLREVVAGDGRGVYFDLDAYSATVERVTSPSVARGTFLLGDKEVNVLREVANYLQSEREIPIEKRNPSDRFNLQLFEVTIDKLTDVDSITVNPHPELRPNEVLALDTAFRYVGWLDRTYQNRES